jgi:SAM-dependent methyltransferase
MSGTQSPAALTMRAMITAGHRARMIQVAAKLGIADILARGPANSALLAAVCGCDADALGRLLRALAASGVFALTTDGAWCLTELGETLSAVAPASCRSAALYWGLDSIRRAWDYLGHSIQTGKPAFDRANGRDFFEHMAAEPTDGSLFDAFITRNQNGRAASHAAAIDCTRLRHVVDVGGGEGAFLAELLKRNPHLTGTVLDLPRAVAAAQATARREHLYGRMDAAEGDFFDEIPSGADAYILASILHDWPDEAAVRILRTCRAAMSPGASLIVIEQILDDAETDLLSSTESDIAMMVLLGGKERTRKDFAALLEAAGLTLAKIAHTATAFGLLIARPAIDECPTSANARC